MDLGESLGHREGVIYRTGWPGFGRFSGRDRWLWEELWGCWTGRTVSDAVFGESGQAPMTIEEDFVFLIECGWSDQSIICLIEKRSFEYDHELKRE